MEPLQIHSKVTDTGIEICFQEKSYPIKYPRTTWNVTPKQTQIALKDNLTLATTIHLPLIFNSPKIIYHSGHPLLEPYFVQNFLKDIPSCTEVDKTNTEEIIRKFFNTIYVFLDPEIIYPSQKPVDSPYKAIIGTSFGKDSLLTYAVANDVLDILRQHIIDELLIL